MIPNDVVETVKSLITRTKAGAVNWAPAQALGLSVGDYGINMGGYAIAVWEYKESWGSERSGIGFQILNDSGKAALEFTTVEEEDGHALMAELFELARRRAMKADVILADLAEKLKGTEPIGSKPRPPPAKESSRAGDDYAKFDDDIPF
jgi:hypothetical protein